MPSRVRNTCEVEGCGKGAVDAFKPGLSLHGRPCDVIDMSMDGDEDDKADEDESLEIAPAPPVRRKRGRPPLSEREREEMKAAMPAAKEGKRKPGRPKKVLTEQEQEAMAAQVKRRRGRPRIHEPKPAGSARNPVGRPRKPRKEDKENAVLRDKVDGLQVALDLEQAVNRDLWKKVEERLSLHGRPCGVIDMTMDDDEDDKADKNDSRRVDVKKEAEAEEVDAEDDDEETMMVVGTRG